MYGRMGSNPNSHADVSFFLGAYLTQVCFGKYDLGLCFDRPRSNIMIQSSFAVQIGESEALRHEIEDVTRLREFLNVDVTKAEWSEQGALILTFAGGNKIMVFDDSDNYESYVITCGTVTIVV